MNNITRTRIDLVTEFLGLTEFEIDNHPLWKNHLKKMGKMDLLQNLKIISYAINQEEYFELIFDKDQDNKVVSQKNYFPEIDNIYNMLLEHKIVGRRCYYSDGFYISNKKFGEVLIEKIIQLQAPECIMTSVS